MNQRVRGVMRVVVGLILVILTVALLILEKPEWFLSPRLLGWLNAYSARYLPYRARWGALRVEVNPSTWVYKKIAFRLIDFCVTRPNEVEACFPEAQFGFAYRLDRIIPELVEIGPVLMMRGTLRVSSPREKVAQRESNIGSGQEIKIPEFISRAVLNPIHIALASVRVEAPGASLDGSAWMKYTDGEFRTEGNIAQYSGKSSSNSIRWFASAINEGAAPIVLDGPWRISTRARIKAARMQGRVRTELVLNRLGLSGRLNFSSIVAIAGNQRVRSDHCGYFYRFRVDEESGRAGTNCLIAARSPKLPSKLFVRVLADVRTPFPLNPAKAVSGRVSLRPILPVSEIAIQGGLETEFSFVPTRLPRVARLQSKLQTALIIPDFSRVVRALEARGAAVPAPFRALNGTVRGGLNGIFDLAHEKGDANGFVSSRLASAQHHLEFETDSEFRIRGNLSQSERIKATGDVLLSKVRFTVPPLKPGIPPQLLPDERFSPRPSQPAGKKGAVASRGLLVDYQLRVRTAGRPVELDSSLLKRPLEAQVDLNLSNGRLQGRIHVPEFPVQGVGQNTSAATLVVDSRKLNGRLAGQVEIGTVEKAFNITASQLAGTVAGQPDVPRSGVQMEVPADQIISSVIFGIPLQVLSLKPQGGLETSSSQLAEQDSREALIELRSRH